MSFVEEADQQAEQCRKFIKDMGLCSPAESPDWIFTLAAAMIEKGWRKPDA